MLIEERVRRRHNDDQSEQYKKAIEERDRRLKYYHDKLSKAQSEKQTVAQANQETIDENTQLKNCLYVS